MPATWKTVRVFISSTFRDMQAERDHMIKVAIPQLRRRCERGGRASSELASRWGKSEAALL